MSADALLYRSQANHTVTAIGQKPVNVQADVVELRGRVGHLALLSEIDPAHQLTILPHLDGAGRSHVSMAAVIETHIRRILDHHPATATEPEDMGHD